MEYKFVVKNEIDISFLKGDKGGGIFCRIEYENGKVCESTLDDIIHRISNWDEEYDRMTITVRGNYCSCAEITHELSAAEIQSKLNYEYLESILGEQTCEINLADFKKITDNIYVNRDSIAIIKDGILELIELYEPGRKVVFKDVLVIPCSEYVVTMDINTLEYQKTGCEY